MVNHIVDQSNGSVVPLENSADEGNNTSHQDFVCAPATNFDKDTMTVKYSEAPRGSAKVTNSEDSPVMHINQVSDSESVISEQIDLRDSQVNVRKSSNPSGVVLQASSVHGSGLYGDPNVGGSSISQVQHASQRVIGGGDKLRKFLLAP